MSDLTTFLLARITEDEELIREEAELGAEFIIPPRRMLAECDAKRRIADGHRSPGDPCDAHDASFQTIACDTLRILALPYADHPDYREEWRL